MFQDCFRCGYGWHHNEKRLVDCICCKNMPDEWAAYVKSHRMVKFVRVMKDWTCPLCKKTMDVEIWENSLAEQGIMSHVH